MRILHLPVHTGGVAYYRHHLPVLALRAAGHEVISPKDGLENWVHATSPKEGDHLQWLWDVLEEGVDVIHGGWSNNPHHIELLVAAREKARVPIIIDYDDDVLNVDKFNVNYLHYHEGAFSRRVARLGMRVADAVTTSTAPLAEALKAECRHVYHLPNFTHPPYWKDLPLDPSRSIDKSVRLMFAGGPSHKGDLDQMKEALLWAINRYDGREGRPHLKVIFFTCMPDWVAPHIQDPRDPTKNRVFFLNQTSDDVELWHRVIKWVAPDILVAPLQRNKFNESKSLIKAYDAGMVEGCAFACENWPAYAEVPDDACYRVGTRTNDRHGMGHPEEFWSGWQSALRQLIEEPDLRTQLSTNLRAWTLADRAISTHTSLWEDTYREVLARPLVSSMSDVVRPRIYAPNGGLAQDQD